LDPLTWEYEYQIPFQYADCDPIANIDLDGLEGLSAIGRATNTAAGFINQTNNIVKTISTVTALLSLGRSAFNMAFNEQAQNKNEKQIRSYLYGSKDAAAIAAGKEIATLSKGGKVWSSVIFEEKDENGKHRYGYTRPASWKNDKRNWNSSPGPDDVIHIRRVPGGAKNIKGHIHLHTGTKGMTGNRSFSPKTIQNPINNDESIMVAHPSMKFYLVNAWGELISNDYYNLPIMTNLPGVRNPSSAPPKVIERLDESMRKKDPNWLSPKGISYY